MRPPTTIADLKGLLVSMMNARPSIALGNGKELPIRDPVDVCSLHGYKGLSINETTFLLLGDRIDEPIFLILNRATEGQFPELDLRLGRPSPAFSVDRIYTDAEEACVRMIVAAAGTKFIDLSTGKLPEQPETRETPFLSAANRQARLPNISPLPAHPSATSLREVIFACGIENADAGDDTDWSQLEVTATVAMGFSGYTISPRLELISIPDIDTATWNRSSMDCLTTKPGLVLCATSKKNAVVDLVFPRLPIEERKCVSLFSDWPIAVYGPAKWWSTERKLAAAKKLLE